jgi:hypothetical protein
MELCVLTDFILLSDIGFFTTQEYNFYYSDIDFYNSGIGFLLFQKGFLQL